MEKREAFYVVDNYDENEHIEWDESYCMLRGPDGFECLLTEPEDRNWYRDGKEVVEKLNALEAENTELRKRVAFLRSCVNGKEELSDKDNAWIDAALEGGKDE